MLRVLHLLVGLLLPACGYDGAAGLPVPGPMDMRAIARPATPNTALAAPAAFLPKPDIVTHGYAMTPDALFAAIERVALAQERTYEQVRFPERRQAHFVVRSRLMNFPDLVTVAVLDGGGLVIWSRSVYGEGDLGVNHARVEAWLATLEASATKP